MNTRNSKEAAILDFTIKFIALLRKEDINCSMCAYQAYQTRSEAISLIYVNEAVAIIDVLRFGLTSQWNVNIHQIARSS